MKIELSKDEQKQLDNAVQQNPIRKWFTARETMKFEVGDVLVKHMKVYDWKTSEHSWKVENINSDTKMAQRYVYIYEDEVGIGYFKQLKVSTGKLGVELFCATDFDFDSTKFEVDPEYAEHTLLDVEFDIKAVHKKANEAKKIIMKMNRKIGVKPKTVKEYNDFFEKVKVGDEIFTSTDYAGKRLNSMTIDKIEKIAVQTVDQNLGWWWRRFKENNPQGVDASDTYKVTYKDQYSSKVERYVMEWNNHIFFATKPALEDKKQS